MRPRLGLRSRILALTMPMVVLVGAATAGIIYLSLGQVLQASAREIAKAEVQELRADVGLHPIAELARTHDDDISTRISQVVDQRGKVVLTTEPRATRPIVEPVLEPGDVRETVTGELPGLDDGTYAVAVTDAVGTD